AVAVATRLRAPAAGLIVVVYRPSPRASSASGLPFSVALNEAPPGTPQAAASTWIWSGWPALTSAPAEGDSIHACGDPAQRTAWSTFRRPPVLVVPASTATGSTVRSRSALSPAPVAPGNTAFASAAAPDTCGVAIDVPSSNRYVPPRQVEYTFVPGAARSTLRAP